MLATDGICSDSYFFTHVDGKLLFLGYIYEQQKIMGEEGSWQN